MVEGADKDEGLGPTAKQMRAAQPYLSMVWKLVGGAVAGVLIGLGLDKWLGTGPWMLVGWSMAGIVVGFYGLVREALRMNRR
jgi:ATP synthase protein I